MGMGMAADGVEACNAPGAKEHEVGRGGCLAARSRSRRRRMRGDVMGAGARSRRGLECYMTLVPASTSPHKCKHQQSLTDERGQPPNHAAS
jgi:hypothetical protein